MSIKQEFVLELTEAELAELKTAVYHAYLDRRSFHSETALDTLNAKVFAMRFNTEV